MTYHGGMGHGASVSIYISFAQVAQSVFQLSFPSGNGCFNFFDMSIR